MQKAKLILALVPLTHNRVYPDSYEHLGLCSLAAMVRKEQFDCTVFDGFFLKLSFEDFVNELLNIVSNEIHYIVGFSVMAEEFLDGTLRAIKLLKNKCSNLTIIAGGMYPTWKAKEILYQYPEIDYILRGEADYSLIDFLLKFSQNKNLDMVDGIVFIKNNQLIEGRFPFPPPDLTKLPAPVRDFAPIAISRNNLLSISTSRGCDFNCSFCGIPGFNGKRRTRTIRQIVDEILMLERTFHPGLINIVDPTLVGSGKRGNQLFKTLGLELLKLNIGVKFSFEIRPDQVDFESIIIWKQVGIEVIHIGVESGVPATLKLFNKNDIHIHVEHAIDVLEKLKIPYSIGFIMFHPWSTLEEIEANIKYSRTILRGKNIIGLFNTLRMYVGSNLSKNWNGAFSPYPNIKDYFIDPKVQHYFSKLTSKEVTCKMNLYIEQQKSNQFFDLMLDLIVNED